MNYKSQLKGWAIDRCIELARVASVAPSLEALKAQADDLAAYAYVESEDLDDTAKALFDLVRHAPAGESKVDALIGTLEHIKDERIRQGLEKDETPPTQQ